jgi:periplasmic divalent cation tolerance protein
MNAILVLTTADDPDLAQRIASELVENNEAACVTLLQGARSFYRWEGALCDEEELVLLIKSVSERFEAVRSRIRMLHSYQLPEVIALPIVASDPEYLDWLQKQVRAAATDASTGEIASP